MLKPQYHKQILLFKCLTLAAIVLIIVGLIATLITLKKYIVVENTFSLLTGAVQLIEDGQWFLFIVVTLFTIVLPFAKLAVHYRVLSVSFSKGTRANAICTGFIASVNGRCSMFLSWRFC